MIGLLEALELARRDFPRGPESLATALGAVVNYSPLSGTEGWCMVTPDRITIRINNSSPLTRQRFTLAHELAHVLIGSDTEILDTQDGCSDTHSEEVAANEIASELLVPKEILVSELGNSGPVSGEAIQKLQQLGSVSWIVVARRIAKDAKSFGVRKAAVAEFRNGNYWYQFPNGSFPRQTLCRLYAALLASGTDSMAVPNRESFSGTMILKSMPFSDALLIQANPS